MFSLVLLFLDLKRKRTAFMNIQIEILDFEMKEEGEEEGKVSPFCLFASRFYPLETITQSLSRPWNGRGFESC